MESNSESASVCNSFLSDAALSMRQFRSIDANTNCNGAASQRLQSTAGWRAPLPQWLSTTGLSRLKSTADSTASMHPHSHHHPRSSASVCLLRRKRLYAVSKAFWMKSTCAVLSGSCLPVIKKASSRQCFSTAISLEAASSSCRDSFKSLGSKRVFTTILVAITFMHCRSIDSNSDA